MNRCMICDITSNGKFSSNPLKPKKNLKFFIYGGNVVCFNCEYPSAKPEQILEEGEVQMIEGGWDD